MTEGGAGVEGAPVPEAPLFRRRGSPLGAGGLGTDLSARGAWAMVRRNLDVFLRTWKVNFLPPLIEPVLYLLALGYGLGALVPDIQGVPYRAFIAPAILSITMMQSAFFETTYSSYVRMYYQKTWEAVVATPLSHDDILVGEVLWAAIRATINTTLMSVVVAAFGLLTFPHALLVPVVAFATGLLFGGIGLFATAKVPAIDAFSYAMYLFITPMFLFSGTFFPLDQLPDAAVWIAYALPLTHTVALTRGLALGDLPDLAPWSVLYLLVGLVVFPWVAVRAAKKRVIA